MWPMLIFRPLILTCLLLGNLVLGLLIDSKIDVGYQLLKKVLTYLIQYKISNKTLKVCIFIYFNSINT